MTTWLLPESVADVLPAEAKKIENIRRIILENFQSYGYELVLPPLIEYEESLLLGSQKDLGLVTFKLVDQISGRALGVRADMTPQVTRIDAHLLNHFGVTRLSYFGSVLHTKASGLLASREPFQMGAEIYGHPGQESEIEVVQLALESLQRIGLKDTFLDFNHSAVIQALLAEVEPLPESAISELFQFLRRKDSAAVERWVKQLPNKQIADAIAALPRLSGGISVLEEARKVLPNIPAVRTALDHLEGLIRFLSPLTNAIGIDFSDVPSYTYHSGITFSVYHSQYPNAIVRGGRYDHMGAAYGRSRHAVGFSFDLKVLAALLPAVQPISAIRAPFTSDVDLQQCILALRSSGEIVVQTFDNFTNAHQLYVFDRELVYLNNEWKVVASGYTGSLV